MTAEAIEQRLGRPAYVEKQPPECPGDAALVVWDYADSGLMLVLAGEGTGETLVSVSNFGSNRFATERGVGIGTAYDEVLAAYPAAADESPASFRVELEGEALEIGFSGGDPPRVNRILLTSETPRIYEEGRECGRPAGD
jgi:hypothetical protein